MRGPKALGGGGGSSREGEGGRERERGRGEWTQLGDLSNISQLCFFPAESTPVRTYMPL